MSETVSMAPEQDETNRRTEVLLSPSPIEWLRESGWSFVTQPNKLKRRELDRMERFDLQAQSLAEKSKKRIDAAYYALELSSPLPPLDEAISNFVNTGDHSYEITDDFLTATAVESTLAEADELYSKYMYADIVKLREQTKEFTDKKTGCLKALKHMQTSRQDLGWISPQLANHAENLLRICIAKENGIDIPAPKDNHLNDISHDV